MIGKKDTKSIFEQYRQVLREQVEDNSINALLNAIKNSNLDEKTRNSLVNLLKDPEVASKWKSGDADTVNAGDSNFAKEMAAAQKEQNLAYPEQEESANLGKYDWSTGCHENETSEQCQARKSKYKTALGSFSR